MSNGKVTRLLFKCNDEWNARYNFGSNYNENLRYIDSYMYFQNLDWVVSGRGEIPVDRARSNSPQGKRGQVDNVMSQRDPLYPCMHAMNPTFQRLCCQLSHQLLTSKHRGVIRSRLLAIFAGNRHPHRRLLRKKE